MTYHGFGEESMYAFEERQQDVAAAGAVRVVSLSQRTVRQHVNVSSDPNTKM